MLKWIKKMNDDKTELMAIGTRSKLSQVIPNLAPMSISGCDIPFSQSVRNLGFYLDETLSMDAHIKYFRGRTYAKKLRFLRKKSRLRKSENAVRLLYAKNSDLIHQNAFSLFGFCTQQRRFVEHLPWV